MKMNKIIAGTGALALSLTMTGIAMGATQSGSQNITATVAENLSLSCGATVDVDGGTDIIGGGSAQSNTTTCAVTTNDADGYHLQIREDTQLTHDVDGTTTIANKTAFNGTNAAAYSGTDLGFRVSNNDTGAMNTTTWGAATTCTGAGATELYAGLPSALTDILEEDDYNAGTSTTTICYALAVGTTQKSGEYSGQVTYSVTTGA